MVRDVLCDQGGNEGTEERLAPPAGVMDELEEAEIGGELLLRDAAMGTQPGAQQGPEAFRRVDVDFAEAIAVIIPRVLATGVADGLVSVAPVLQPA